MAGDPFADLRKAIDRFAKASGRGSGRPAPGRIPPGMIGITIRDDSAENGKGLDRIFDAFGATMKELPDVLRDDALPAIRAAHRKVFETEGKDGRGAWPALAPRTLRERARLGFGPGPILERTGALKEHVLSAPAVIRTRGRTVELRIRPAKEVDGVPKYDALAKGYENIPARPMVAVGPAEARKITSAIQRGLRARASRNGLA